MLDLQDLGIIAYQEAKERLVEGHYAHKENKMDVPENEIRIYYKHGKKIVKEWDLAIEDALFAFGLKRWASGFDLTNGVRDLAFRPETEEEFIKSHG